VNELALFAGAGGGILGGHLLGWRTICAVEWEPYAASVLVARQNDGILPPFPIWDDVQTFDGRPWRGIVDVVSGGFPCQDISAAGKGAGIEGERSGMWREMARVVSEVRPRFVFVENSPMLVTRGLERVLGDLTEIGYDTKWTVMGAADVGAPHQRDRIWIKARRRDILSYPEHNGNGRWEQQSEGVKEAHGNVAHASDQRLWPCGRGDGIQFNPENRGRDNQQTGSRADVEPSQARESQDLEEKVSNPNGTQFQGNQRSIGIGSEHANACGTSWWEAEPNVGRVVDGVASRMDRLKAIGNGQVPEVARTAWEELS